MSKSKKEKDKESEETSSKNDFTKSHSRTNNTVVKIPSYAWKVLGILSCIATMVMYAETMLIPAIPTLIADLDISYGLSSWLLTSYLITGAVMTPIAGKLSDIYGRKKILLIIMVIYTIGVSIAGFTNDIVTMIIARSIQGIGMSMFPIAFGIIRDQFPREKISIGQGVITSMFAIGSVIGLSVGGIIIQHFGWKMTFFSIIPISIVLLLVIKKFIHVIDNKSYKKIEKKSHDKGTKLEDNANRSRIKIDIKGAITLSITITSFLLALTLLQSTNNDSNTNDNGVVSIYLTLETILPYLITGIISLLLFIKIELDSEDPLINFKIFVRPTIFFSSLIIMIIGLSMFMIFQTIPILVQIPEPIGFGMNTIDTGKVQLPFAIVLLLFGPTSGLIISRLGSINPMIFGSVLTTFGFTGLFLFHSTELFISTGLGILSAGLSFTAVGAMNIIILSTPHEYSGVTIGMSSLLRIIGSSIGPALAAMYMQTNQTIFHVRGLEIVLPSTTSFNLIFFTAILFSIVSILLAIILKIKMKQTSLINI